MPSEPIKRLTLELPWSLYQNLESAAKRNDQSIAAYVRALIATTTQTPKGA